MSIAPHHIEIIGLIMTGLLVVAGFLKMLRNDGRLTILMYVTVAIAVIGFFIRGPETKMVNGNAADTFFGPLIYVFTYTLLRELYKKIYKKEPTYERYSWYDAEEGRHQNWLDVLTHLVPTLLSFVVPVVIGAITDRYP